MPVFLCVYAADISFFGSSYIYFLFIFPVFALPINNSCELSKEAQ